VTELSLPSSQLDHEQLKLILLLMQQLEILDVQWGPEIKQLLELVGVLNLKVLTVRIRTVELFIAIDFSTKSWIDYWIMKEFVPPRLNIVISVQLDSYKNAIWNSWIGSHSVSPTGCTGHVKLYRNDKIPFNFFPVLPVFQLDFGRGATSPFVRASNVGLPGLERDLLLLTDCVHHGMTIQKAVMRRESLSSFLRHEHLNNSITSFEFLTELALLFGGSLCSKHLERIGFACPNLKRLNLRDNKQCLKRLQGLRTIASKCRKLQGLNLNYIPVNEVENQTCLWKILSDMKLTHLGVKLCVLLPSVRDEKIISYFSRCESLQAIESDIPTTVSHGSIFLEGSLTVLSHFSSLAYFVIHGFYTTFGICRSHNTSAVQDILTSCKDLKCLNYYEASWKSIQLIQTQNLQQLKITSRFTDLSYSFMSTISTHGGLIHVLLEVRSMASDGISILVRNSPKLMTFHATLHGQIGDSNGANCGSTELEPSLRQELSQRQLSGCTVWLCPFT